MEHPITQALDLQPIDQIGFVYRDLKQAIADFEPIFGEFDVQEYGAYEYNYRGKQEMAEVVCAFASSGDLQIELIGWVSGGTPHKEFLDAGREGMHHIRFPVDNLEETKDFYCDLIGCTLGRSSEIWIDFNMFGHQVVAHKTEKTDRQEEFSNPVDGKDVPIPHFGVVLEWDQWHALANRLKSAKVNFTIEPYIRFEGEAGEQATMFLLDPSGNALEFKSFKDISQMFAN